MDHVTTFLAPLAVLLSGAIGVDPQSELSALQSAVGVDAHLSMPSESDDAAQTLGWSAVAGDFRSPVQHQVRIERSITIRITPRGPAPPDFADQPMRWRLPPRVAERRMPKCLPIAGIAGVQVTRDNRLLLFMRDQRVVSLGLEKACRAQDFYSGFYIDRSPDGQICAKRDRLQSRSGANCQLTHMRQLIGE